MRVNCACPGCRGLPPVEEAHMRGYRFSVLIGREGEGWAASCPDFAECRAWGSSYEEALANIREAIRVFVEDGLGDDEPPPENEGLSFTTLIL